MEKGMGKQYIKRTLPRVHYEDMWSPYEKCREIENHEWMGESYWKENNLVELFKRKSRELLAELNI